MAVEKIRITAELLDGEDNVVSTDSVTGDYQEPDEDVSDTCDMDFISSSNGGPTMRPRNPPSGL